MTHDPTDHLRRQAKDLSRAYASGDATARMRVAAVNPRDGALKHADFLHVIAVENNFPSWPMLKDAVARHGMDRAARIQRLKIGLAHGQTQVVAALMEETPDLAKGHFGLEVALLDAEAVLAQLANDPKAATTAHGPMRPILHLAFSKAIHIWPDRKDAMLQIAEALVANGADVNDRRAHPEGDLSALYGAIGHANNMALGEWLLKHGADPNDGESLYHATELGHHDGLRMLIAHGADPKGTNALLRAMDFDDLAAIRMLLDAGADPNEHVPHPQGGAPMVLPALHQAARRMCSDRVCETLLDAGADPRREHGWASAYAFARVYGHPTLARMIEDRGAATPLSQEETILANAAAGLAQDGVYLDQAQVPPAYRGIIRDIVHLPGKLPHIKALVALGLFYDAPDSEGLTPVQVAGWEGLPEMLAYFLSLRPDLSHVNGYGGTLLSTIIHGSENAPDRAARDHVGCARLALEQGVALPRRAINMAGDPKMRAFLADWAAEKPGQVVAHGVA